MADWFDNLLVGSPAAPPAPPPPPDDPDPEEDWFSRLLAQSPQEAMGPPPGTQPPAPPPTSPQEPVTPVERQEYQPSREYIPSASLVQPAPGSEVTAEDYRPGEILPRGPEDPGPLLRQAGERAAALAGRGGSALVRGLEDVNRGLLGAVEAGGADIEAFGRRAQEEGVPMAGPLFELFEEAGRGLRQVGEQSVPEVTPFSSPEGEKPALIEDVLQAAPSFAAGIGAALAAGPQGAMAFLGAQELGGQYKKAQAEGASHEEAVQDAVLYAAGSALLESYGVGKVLENAFPGASKNQALDFAKRWAKSFAAEGGTEATQDVASELSSVLRRASDQGLAFDDVAEVFSEENLRQYGRTALVGGILGQAPVLATAGMKPGEAAPESPTSAPPQEVGRKVSTRVNDVAPPPLPDEVSASLSEESVEAEPASEPPSPREGERPGSGLSEEAIDSWIGRLGEGPPGLSSQDVDGALGIVYRDPRGRTVSAAVLSPDGKSTDLLFTDKRRGALGARAAVAVGRDLQSMGVTEARGEISQEALRARERLEESEQPGVETQAAPEAPEAVEQSLVERLPAAQEGEVRGGPNEAGFIRRPDQGVMQDVRIAVERQVKPQGNLPVSAWKLKLQKDHNLAAHMKGMEYRLRELNRGIRRYEGPLTKAQLTRYLGDALRGTVPLDLRAETAGFDETQIERIASRRGIDPETVRAEFERTAATPPSGLPSAPELAPIVAKLRADIDAVTRSLRREGMLDDAAARDLERSAGLYVHRSYEAFRGESKQHLQKVEKTPLWNRAKQLIQEEYPDFTPEEVDGHLREFVERGDRPTLPGNVPEGALNRSVLFRRQGVRDLERLLLGERRDIRSQALDTLIGQTSLLEHHRFLKALREDGLGKYLFDRPQGRYYRNIEEAPSPVSIVEQEEGQEPEARTIYRKATHRRYGAMTASGEAGGKALHTTPEILRELEDAMPQMSEWPLWLKLWSLGNFAVKTNLTVLSPTTTGRNYLSNVFSALANGYTPFGKGLREGKALVFRDIANSSDDGLRDLYQKFLKLGIVDQGTDYGDLRRLGQFADLMRVETDPAARPVSWAKSFLRKAGQVYQHGDNFWKILAWSQERARQEKVHPEWGSDRLDREAADIVKRVLQNYSELPRLARSISSNPVVAPFFSFTWSMFRNVKETALQAHREIRNENPEVRKIGYRRAAGMIAALSLPEMLTFALRYMSNTDDEDDWALRQFVYPWDRGSNLGIVSHRPGEYTYFNWGFMDYFSRLKEPVRLSLQAASGSRDADEVAADAFADYGEEVLFGALIDVARGETADGFPVYLEGESFAEKLTKSMGHLWRTGRPGVARNVENLADASQDRRGRKLWAEIAALAGPRFTTVDVPDRLDRFGGAFSRQLAGATRVYSQYANRSDDPGKEKLLRSYRRANEERMDLLVDLRRKMEAGVMSGLPIDEVESTLVDGGVPKKYVDMAWGGTFDPVSFRRGKHWGPAEAELENLAAEAEAEWPKRLFGAIP